VTKPVGKTKSPKQMGPRILVAQGVNLDLLGKREPEIYGAATLSDIEAQLRADAPSLSLLAGVPVCELSFFQSNSEGEFLAHLSQGFDGILINPGAWTHTSLALADRLKGLAVPYVEVHLSNIASRESIRHVSLTAPAAEGCVSGLGIGSYRVGLLGLLLALKK
jgi:3-dehydroquinate dehydratase-2